MTPTSEMIAMARECAAPYFPEVSFFDVLAGKHDDKAPVKAALAAIMEVSEKVSEMADGRRTDDGSLWDAAMEDFGDAIRNGEYLRRWIGR